MYSFTCKIRLLHCAALHQWPQTMSTAVADACMLYGQAVAVGSRPGLAASACALCCTLADQSLRHLHAACCPVQLPLWPGNRIYNPCWQPAGRVPAKRGQAVRWGCRASPASLLLGLHPHLCAALLGKSGPSLTSTTCPDVPTAATQHNSHSATSSRPHCNHWL